MLEENTRKESLSSVMLTSFPRSALFREKISSTERTKLRLKDVLSGCKEEAQQADCVYSYDGSSSTFWFSL